MDNSLILIRFKVIICEEPEVPAGSYVVGYDFNIHSSIEYHCEVGYLLHGEAKHTCGKNGEWTGEVPSCECKLPTFRISLINIFFVDISLILLDI